MLRLRPLWHMGSLKPHRTFQNLNTAALLIGRTPTFAWPAIEGRPTPGPCSFQFSKSMFQKLFSLFRRPECPKTKLIRLALQEANKQLSLGELVKAKVMAGEAVKQIHQLEIEKAFFEERELTSKAYDMDFSAGLDSGSAVRPSSLQSP